MVSVRCPKSRFQIRIIVFDKLELIIFVSQGFTLSTASIVWLKIDMEWNEWQPDKRGSQLKTSTDLTKNKIYFHISGVFAYRCAQIPTSLRLNIAVVTCHPLSQSLTKRQSLVLTQWECLCNCCNWLTHAPDSCYTFQNAELQQQTI